MSDAATTLADWATSFEVSPEDRALAKRALLDTVAVAHAAREHPLRSVFGELSEPGRWAAFAHVLDFDDLHMPSTTHISAVCVPVALAGAEGGGSRERAYLAGAGVMARLGTALGWRHYTAGWHATCTAGAPAAAAGAAVARGLDAEGVANAMALALPAAGGVQRAFGTAAKSLQVAFVVEAGLRAAGLAEAGASADPGALEQWIELVGGDPAAVAAGAGATRAGAAGAGAGAANPGTARTKATANPGPGVGALAVPDGLAIKLYPCCYALQRPISAVIDLKPVAAQDVKRITVRTPRSSLTPLIHSVPRTGLEGKFSLEYGIAAAILDGRPGLNSFSDEAVTRPEAKALMQVIEVTTPRDGEGLLDGELTLEIETQGQAKGTTLALPPGAPGRPPTDTELQAKLEACGLPNTNITWETAAFEV